VRGDQPPGHLGERSRKMSRTTRIVGIGTVGVPVSDQDRALEFYVGKLGFETRRNMPFGPGRWIEVAPPGSATTIALVPEGVPAGIRLMTTDADGDHADLRAGGVRRRPGGHADPGGPGHVLPARPGREQPHPGRVGRVSR
jgi:catechol 2,3-dioxygenase-like lactoylglutathione lyase family enzyme